METPSPPTRPDAPILELIRVFDPISPDAEAQYDGVVRRLSRARARSAVNARERETLEAQFLEGDLAVQSGPRRGQPLSLAGRRKRLNRLIELAVEAERLQAEERFSQRVLDRMNDALDRWARETYGAP